MSRNVIVLSTQYRDTARGLADVFQRAGYATIWHRSTPLAFTMCGSLAGVWDGGQLNGCEAEDLVNFCRTLARDAAPVIAMLDFPRRDRLEWALASGAAAVLGKPWRNADLIGTVQLTIDRIGVSRAA